MQEVYEDRTGEGRLRMVGDSVGPVKCCGMNSMKSSLVVGISLLKWWIGRGKESRKIIGGCHRLQRWKGSGSGEVVECKADFSVLWQQSAATLVQRFGVCTKKMRYTRERKGQESDGVEWGRGKGGTTLEAQCW